MQPLSGPSIHPTFSLACTFPNSKSTSHLPPGKTGKVTAPHSSTLPLRVCLCPAQHKECTGILIRGEGGKQVFPLCTRASWDKIRASFPLCHHSSLPTCSGKNPNGKKKSALEIPVYLLPGQQIYSSQPGHRYESEGREGGSWAQADSDTQKGYPYFLFEVSRKPVINPVLTHTQRFIETETKANRARNEKKKKD